MRESKRKTNGSEGENDSNSLQLELELVAVRAKNAELIKTHTKLLQDNSDMKSQIFSLQADLVDIQAKYNNVYESMQNLQQSIQRCTPNLLDLLNLFLQVADSCKNSSNIVNIFEKAPKTSVKAITHTVKPHTVNGTVLNLNPTISLPRLSAMNIVDSLNEVTSMSPRMELTRSLPSTSNYDNRENECNGLGSSEVGDHSFVSRRNPIKTKSLVTETSLIDETENLSSDESDDDDENNEQMLSPIQEESICSNPLKRKSFGEVRIYLSRLSLDEIRPRISPNKSQTSFSSTAAQVNDTCLNIETTVIENSDNMENERLRADIMVFSPHTNSTRLESGNSRLFLDTNSGSRESIKAISVSAVSPIQAPEMTTSAGVANVDQVEIWHTNAISSMPTPSMSAMGDIDPIGSTLDILSESENRNDENAVDSIKISPTGNTRSMSRSLRINSKSDVESPRSSRESLNTKSSISFVSRRRGTSNESVRTPTIVLERLENILPDHRISANTINIHILGQTLETDTLLSKKTNRKSKRGSSKTRNQSPKRSGKRMKKDDGLSQTALKDKILEVQQRLSDYIPDPSEDSKVSVKQRPSRAAKPKNLKDASLKVKLRRMF